MSNKIKILYLCTGNSCRSQMAEGWTRHLKGDVIDAFSAGIETHGLNPNAVQVMKEVGVDISTQISQNIKDFELVEFDYVITVCSHAHQNCPFFPAKSNVIHIGFEDPPHLASLCESNEDKLDCYRLVRDEIKSFVLGLPEILFTTS